MTPVILAAMKSGKHDSQFKRESVAVSRLNQSETRGVSHKAIRLDQLGQSVVKSLALDQIKYTKSLTALGSSEWHKGGVTIMR